MSYSARIRRLSTSVAAPAAVSALAAVTVAVSLWPAGPVVVAVLTLVLLAGTWWVGRLRSGPVTVGLAVVAVLIPAGHLVARGQAGVWVALTAAVAVLAALAGEPLARRLVPPVRAVQLPGVPSDPRPRVPAPFAYAVLAAGAMLAVLLLIASAGDLPDVAGVVVLVLELAALLWSAVRLRSAVWARRRGTVNRAVTQAITAHAPQFYVYFSGPIEGAYQVRMWLPFLERLGVPYAVLGRDAKLLAQAPTITTAPVVVTEKIAGLDDCLVPSVRAVFYVNTDSKCVDGVRYLDRTHVHLNHGDSDKPSSYHPMIGMFDQIFVAGDAAVDRFTRHGVVVAPEKFVRVGRPQVAGILDRNIDPAPGRRTVLYAPTWRGGVRDMNFSSLEHGEQIVRLLLDRGVRVIFRPHPISCRKRRTARTVAAIDAVLGAASTPDCPHVTSRAAMSGAVADVFNRSDALVTDVSSVASDYLQSGKPFAVVDPVGAGADESEYPVLRAAYMLDLDSDPGARIDTMLGADPLAQTRRELRSYYLGDHCDSAEAFTRAAARALGDTRP